MNAEEASLKFVGKLHELIAAVALPATLSQYGLPNQRSKAW
ncbi:hypothetical protein [Paenibacillus mangrovi]|nr:hypothetical protein [Paenibacillus mangrovi]